MSDKPKYAVGVSVLITKGDSLLLGERTNTSAAGLLSTPGGRIEQEEDIFSCAVRETMEETGLSLTKELLRVVAWREHFRFGQHYFMFYVHAPQSFGTIENREPEKCKGWEWRKIGELKAEETTEPLEILYPLLVREVGNENRKLEKIRYLAHSK
jgi:8-oxo-dGTP diphosphatase